MRNWVITKKKKKLIHKTMPKTLIFRTSIVPIKKISLFMKRIKHFTKSISQVETITLVMHAHTKLTYVKF